jgi:hypothetical protein
LANAAPAVAWLLIRSRSVLPLLGDVGDSNAPPLDQAAVLRTLLDHHVEFLLVGGSAANAYGATRLTTDLDVVPRPLNLAGVDVDVASLSDIIVSKETTNRSSDREALGELYKLRDQTVVTPPSDTPPTTSPPAPASVAGAASFDSRCSCLSPRSSPKLLWIATPSAAAQRRANTCQWPLSALHGFLPLLDFAARHS